MSDDDDDKPLNIEFTLRPWQAKVSQQLKKFNVLIVHRGAGKSFMCCLQIMMRALTGPARAEYLFLGPYKNQMHRNVWSELTHIAGMIPHCTVNNNRLEVLFRHNMARITVLGADDPESLRGKHVHGAIIDEFDDMPAMDRIWPIIFPMTTNHDAWMIMVGTPKGRKNLWAKLQEAKLVNDPTKWHTAVLDYNATGALRPDQIELARQTMSPDMFAQEYSCSFEASNVGAYYTKQITELRSNGNIVYDRFLYDPSLEVHCSFDIGMRDFTSVWWFQVVKDKASGEDTIHFIDFEQSANLGLPDWNDILISKERDLGYRRGEIIFPHDIKVREWGANVSRIEAAEKLGIVVAICPDHLVPDRIELMRLHLPKCKFDGRRCEEGIEALAQYREKTDKNGNGMGIPMKDGNDHSADSCGYGMLYVKQVMNQPSLIRIPMIRRR